MPTTLSCTIPKINTIPNKVNADILADLLMVEAISNGKSLSIHELIAEWLMLDGLYLQQKNLSTLGHQ
jgi:hypothetical protein